LETTEQKAVEEVTVNLEKATISEVEAKAEVKVEAATEQKA